MLVSAEVECLKKNRISDARRISLLEKWVDIIGSTPLWKRIWFVMQGYRFRRLGVWYRASWNRDGYGY